MLNQPWPDSFSHVSQKDSVNQHIRALLGSSCVCFMQNGPDSRSLGAVVVSLWLTAAWPCGSGKPWRCSAKFFPDAIWKRPRAGTAKGNGTGCFTSGVIVFLRLTDVWKSLSHQPESLGWSCASCEGLVTDMWADKFCRHFPTSQDGTHLEAIRESSSQGYEGVCGSYIWMQMNTG